MKHWDEMEWWNNPESAKLEAKLIKSPRFSYQPYQWYKAINLTPFHTVKVVILGQDPYPTRGMATGLAFSIPEDLKPFPPTFHNIFREYCDDLHFPYPKSGDLSAWAKQGVLLWNSVLTVEPGKPGSHKGLGWEGLTEEVLRSVQQHRENVVFMLWGREAQKYLHIVLPDAESKKHRVILSSHPSPLSARKGFLGSRPFSTANAFLKNPVNWRL